MLDTELHGMVVNTLNRDWPGYKVVQAPLHHNSYTYKVTRRVRDGWFKSHLEEDVVCTIQIDKHIRIPYEVSSFFRVVDTGYVYLCIGIDDEHKIIVWKPDPEGKDYWRS